MAFPFSRKYISRPDHDETCEREQHCFSSFSCGVFIFGGRARRLSAQSSVETGVELFRLVQEHQVAALVELVDLTVAPHFGSKAVYHVQTVGFGLCAEYGVRNGNLFRLLKLSVRQKS